MFSDVTDEMYNELLEAEITNLQDVDRFIGSNQMIPISAFMAVSNIAFRMAMQSLNSSKEYTIAPILRRNINKIYNSNKVSLYDKDRLRREIGEMDLDFNYAAGNHDISSLRLSHYIRAKHIKDVG